MQKYLQIYLQKHRKIPTKDTDKTTKIIRKNSSTFSIVGFKQFNKLLVICKFLLCLEMANVTPVYEKGNRSAKTTIIRSAFYKFIKIF